MGTFPVGAAVVFEPEVVDCVGCDKVVAFGVEPRLAGAGEPDLAGLLAVS